MKFISQIILLSLSWLFPFAAVAQAKPALAEPGSQVGEINLPYDHPLETSASFLAQVTVDGTTSTTVTDTDTGVRIENGNRDGGNLFHSFDKFSIPTGSEAYFNNPSDLINIFSRVTGGDVSNINGLIRANGGANLFLINPSGIVLGEGAKLQLGGSFYGSTADTILFPDGEFSATDLNNPPLITINAPIGLSFRDNPQPIINRSVADNLGLEVNTGETIGLIGGEIEIIGNGAVIDQDNPINNITAQGAKVWLGGLAQAGTVRIEENLIILPNGAARANVVFANGARVDVASAGEGEITVIGNNITLTQASQLIGGIAENSGITESQAGDITIDGTGAIELRGESSIENRVNSNAIGNSGDIKITGASLSLTDGGRLSSSTFAQGNAGDITVNTTGTVTLNGIANSGQRSRIASGIASNGTGEGGDITVNAGSLSLADGALLNTRTAGFGNAGNITIIVDREIAIAGFNQIKSLPTSIISELDTGATGSAGNIRITANTFALAEKALLSSSTSGRGNAGQIKIKADETVSLDSSSSILSNVALPIAVGDAGGVEITTTNLSLSNGAQINANTFGQGNAGTIVINAQDNIDLDGEDTQGSLSGVYSAVGDTAIGDAGGIEITTANLTVTNGGKINASTFGGGNAGTVRIIANDTITLEGKDLSDFSSGIFSNVEEEARGSAGGIEIAATNLTLVKGGTISASTFGQGNAGIVKVNASEQISLVGIDSDIINAVEDSGIGNAGGIEITTGSLSITNQAEINASSTGDGNGGSVAIFAEELDLNQGEISATNTPSITTTENREGGNINLEIFQGLVRLSNNSLISAEAGENASGGNITINADLIFAFPNQNNDITANAELGSGGNIEILAESILGIEERAINPITNDINASSESGVDGSVSIKTPDNNPFRETTELAENVVSPGIVTANACDVSDSEGAVGILVVKGRGGVSPKPTDSLNSDGLIMIDESAVLELWQNYEPSKPKNLVFYPNLELNSAYIPPQIQPVAYKDNGEPIYIARGVIKQADGSIILTAVPQDNGVERGFVNTFSCQ